MSTLTSSKPSILNQTVSGGLGVLGGLWLVVSPFILYDGYKDKAAKEAADTATTAGIVLGIVAILLAVFCIVTENRVDMFKYRMIAGVSMVVMGVYMFLAPELSDFASFKDPTYNLQFTGAAFILIAGFVTQEIYYKSKR